MKYNIKKINKKDFPEKLKKIKRAPKFLYVIGNEKLLWEDSFGIVGTRKISEYGIRNCENFTKEFVFRNIPVVSGMALGTDSVAHKTVIEYGGKTIAVLGSGFGNIFPKENTELFEKIVETNGLVVTEFEYETKPLKENFPKRNRIITALSEGILVIEAGYRSGSSITAKNAIEQNKMVFALPGQLDSKVGIGVNNLIKKGAIFTTEIEDIIDKYPQFGMKKRKELKKKNSKLLNLKNEYKEIYKILEKEESDIETILIRSNMEIRDILKILTNMEMEGIIKQNSLGKYVLSNDL